MEAAIAAEPPTFTFSDHSGRAPSPSTATKVCNKCGVVKDVGEFKLMPHAKGDYRRGQCHDCFRVSNRDSLRKYRKSSGEKIQARHRERLATDPEYAERKRQQARAKYQRSREYKANYQRAYRNSHREQVRATDKNKRLKKEYGITLEQFVQMVSEQDFKCPICKGEIAADSKSHIDHCHATGVVRGVLCGLCNIGLGSFKDRQESLLAAIEYLKSPPAINRETNTHAKEIETCSQL